MSIEGQLLELNKHKKNIEKIQDYLVKNKVENISDHLILSHLKAKYNDDLTPRENHKVILKNIIAERILNRRRNILTHSCIYYRFDTNVIKDHEYDKMCRELTYLQQRFPKISEEVGLYNIFKDWGNEECTSGYSLPINNLKVIERAERVIALNKWYSNG